MIYLDNASTTRINSNYIFEITEMLKKFGNPSNHYTIGFETRKIIEEARNTIAECLNCGFDEIYFTSGASEGNAWALHQRKRCVCSAYEHHNILNNPNSIFIDENYIKMAYEKNRRGSIFLGNWSNFIYSHMFVNNITGEIFDIEQLSWYTHQLNEEMLFHSDMTQALGNINIDFKELSGIDIATFSGHKIHAPKGIGFIYFNKNTFDNSHYLKTIQPLIYGGGQENNKRAGTENVPYIHVLGLAVQKAVEDLNFKQKHSKLLKTKLITELAKSKMDYIVISPANSINSTFAFCIKNVESELIQSMLADHEIYIGVGSACNQGTEIDKVDSVLNAMQISEDYNKGLIRVSFSLDNTLEEIELFVRCLTIICEELGLNQNNNQ